MIEFKKAGIEDLKNIQQVAYATWPVAFGKVLPKEQIDYMLELIYNEESLKKQITEKGHIFILVENEKAFPVSEFPVVASV